MARRRLGVALLLDDPVAAEVDGLRRALADRSLSRIPPHVTLVPPVNVRADDLPAALSLVRRAAHECGGPLRLILGPPASFLPANAVVHLPVGGDLEVLAHLREAVFAGPLARSLAWPWVPHVTLADDAEPDRIPGTLAALAGYRVVTAVDRLVVLEERRGGLSEGRADPAERRAGLSDATAGLSDATAGPQEGRPRRWEALADADLAPAAVVGRGGLDLTVVQGRVLDPDAAGLVGTEPHGGARRLVVTGIVGGTVVGVGVAWRADDGGHVLVRVAPDRRRVGVGRQLLARLELAVRRAGWDCPSLTASGPAAFYSACSRWSVVPASAPQA